MYINKKIKTDFIKDELTTEQVHSFITEWKAVADYATTNRLYYIGEDPYILSGQRSDGTNKGVLKGRNVVTSTGIQNKDVNDSQIGNPDWRIPVAYASKIVHTISGYMYKPGSIQIISADDNQTYLDELNKIASRNDGKIKNSELGLNQSIYGTAYELISTDGTENANPRYTQIPLSNGIPVYDYSLEEKLKAFIYYFVRDNTTFVTVFYAWGKQEYMIQGAKTSEIIRTPYIYGEVPIAIYQNGSEEIGDFDRVKKLIDAYDYLVSDNINELERFAQAYLILINARVEAGKEHEVKEKRVMQLNENGAAQFLTKDINADHMAIMAELLRKEIHKQSSIVDFMDEKVGSAGLSGAAIKRMMIDMNNLANIKEIYFEKGLRTRYRLISKILLMSSTAESPELNFKFSRDIPEDLVYYGDWLLKAKGNVSQMTALEQVPFVEDPNKEIEKLNEELQIDGIVNEKEVEAFVNGSNQNR